MNKHETVNFFIHFFKNRSVNASHTEHSGTELVKMTEPLRSDWRMQYSSKGSMLRWDCVEGTIFTHKYTCSGKKSRYKRECALAILCYRENSTYRIYDIKMSLLSYEASNRQS